MKRIIQFKKMAKIKKLDGEGNTTDTADGDHDGVSNLVEYSQGMNPTTSNTNLSLALSSSGNSLQYIFRKSASDLSYTLQQSQNLTTWITSTLT